MSASKLNNEESEKFWNDRYITHDTGWDLGQVSPPIKAYLDQLQDKNLRILIPGCGNAYEAEYLLTCGFTNITLIDIAPLLVQQLQEKFNGYPNIRIINDDFFNHNEQYDLIIEQTFFCALNPKLRTDYIIKMDELLIEKGKLVGLLFASEFDKKEGPPFGGNIVEYQELYSQHLTLKTIENCYNSFEKRQGNELFFIAVKC